MARPHVQISAPNHIADLRQHLEEMMPQLVSLRGIVGLTLNGGLSRGYADHLSEIDVTLYLTPEAFEAWQNGNAPVPAGITMLNGQLYDIKYVNYATERERTWEQVALWDASYAEILYDPDGCLHELFAEKLEEQPDPGTAEGLLMSCWWYSELAGEIWIHRGDAPQGHHMLNQAMNSLVQALFAANREYIPHEKWLLHMSRTLEWTPVDWADRLTAAMSTGDSELGSLRTRQEVLRELWSEVDQYVRDTYYPHLPIHVMQRTTYEQLKLLAEQGSMTVAEWQVQTDSPIPNGDPFHPVIRIEDGVIYLDHDALLKVGPDDMYVWHYEVLRAIAERA